MTQEELCQELIDADVVRIDIIPASGSTMPIPFAVHNISQMRGRYPNPSPLPSGSASFASALLTVAQTWGDGVDATMKSSMTHKVTPARDAMGIVRTHVAQVPIERGFQSVRTKEDALQGVDFHIVLTTYDGTQYMAYGLPNSSQFALEEQDGESLTMTVKMTVKSMSGLIRLTTG